MPGQREVLPDRVEAREKRLRATDIAKAGHLALAPEPASGRFRHGHSRVRRFYENVLHTSEHCSASAE
jgi:hypothetical protein